MLSVCECGGSRTCPTHVGGHPSPGVKTDVGDQIALHCAIATPTAQNGPTKQWGRHNLFNARFVHQGPRLLIGADI